MNKQDEEELMLRIQSLEDKMDRLLVLVERASGAWLLTKWVAAIAVSLASIWAAIKGTK